MGEFQVMFHMFGTYVMYLDIGRDDDNDYDNVDCSNEDCYKESTNTHLKAL